MIFEPTAYRRLARGDRGRGRNFSLAASVFPDVNLIEMPYSKFKAFLRKLAARSVPALRRAIGCFIPSSPSRMYQLFQAFRICFDMTL
jgi:hypothetical protein